MRMIAERIGAMASIRTETATAHQRRLGGLSARRNFREYGMLLALVVIMVFFQIMTDGVLLKPLNLTNLFLQNSYIVIMALGMLLVIVSRPHRPVGRLGRRLHRRAGGGDDGATTASPGRCRSILLCLMVGAVIGAAQGYWIAYWRIPSFIVTLAGMLVFRGLTLWLLNGRVGRAVPQALPARSSPASSPTVFGAPTGLNLTGARCSAAVAAAALIWGGRARPRQGRRATPRSRSPSPSSCCKNGVIAVAIVFIAYLLATCRGLPNVLITMAVLIVAYTFVTNKTTIGRRIYALGGNEKAAKLSGIKTDRLIFLVFANMGVLAALAGLIFAARLNTATPKAGVGFELDVIAACFIGGASASGGVGHDRRRGDRRLHHGRDEQRHVDHGHRHRLPAGDQGPGAARRRDLRRLQQVQVALVQVALGARHPPPGPAGPVKRKRQPWRSNPPHGRAVCARRNGSAAPARTTSTIAAG